jgi:acylphosphatase
MKAMGNVGADVNKKGKPLVAESGGMVAVMSFSVSMFTIAGIASLSNVNEEIVLPLQAASSVFIAASIIGFIDDYGLVTRRQKAVLVIFAGLPLVFLRPVAAVLEVPFHTFDFTEYQLFGFHVTYILFWLVIVPFGVMAAANAFNMAAGYNGLESGIPIIASAAMVIVLMIKGHDAGSAVVFAGLIGAASAVFHFNKFPAKVFVGRGRASLVPAETTGAGRSSSVMSAHWASERPDIRKSGHDHGKYLYGQPRINPGNSMNIRGTFKVTGIVQGVRYREAVLRLARERGLVGYVKNRRAGSVKVVAEGEESVVKAFPEALQVRSGRIEVDRIVAEYSAAKGRFTRFRIIRGRNLSDGELEILEKLDTGLDITENLARRQDAAVFAIQALGTDIKSADGHIQSLDNHVLDTDRHITDMDRNIGGHFDRLDRKYDAFGASLSQAAGDIHDMTGDIRDVKSDIREVKADIHEVAASRRGKVGKLSS